MAAFVQSKIPEFKPNQVKYKTKMLALEVTTSLGKKYEEIRSISLQHFLKNLQILKKEAKSV